MDITVSNIDKIAPENSAPILTATTNSITATFNQKDNESGIDNATIRYGIAEHGSSNYTWQESKTFTGLKQGSVYDLKTRVTDNAGNETISNLQYTTTGTVATPTITSSTTNWTNQDVTATITYPSLSDGVNEYSLTGDSGSWIKASGNKQEVTITNNTTTIYARIKDSTGQYGKTASYTITNIDKQLPVISDMYFGGMLYEDPTFSRGNNSIKVYNNLYNDSVKHERINMTTPYGNNAIKITTNGKADPDLGGFEFYTQTSPSETFISKIVAKIPKGYKLNFYSNLIGNDYKGDWKWLTSNEGTGEWEEYIYKVTTGSSGTFNTTNFYSISGGKEATKENPLVWYLAYATVFSDKKYNGNQGISFKSTDNSGIAYYGVSESSTQTPTWKNAYSQKNIVSVITELVGNKNYCLWVKDIAGNIAKKEFKISTVEIGDVINYKPDVTSASSNGVTQENLTWKVSNVYDDGTIKLIGSESNGLITLAGADGYNNGVTRLNTVCRTLYSKENYKARSIRLEDFEEHMTAKANEERNNYIYKGHRYGDICTYNSTYDGRLPYYPAAFEYEKDAAINGQYNGAKNMSDEISTSELWKTANTIAIKHRAYYLPINNENYGNATNLLYENETYWIATRRNRCDDGHGDFGLFVGHIAVDGRFLCSSNESERTLSYRYKPVIELDKNIVLKHNGNGTHDISQY